MISMLSHKSYVNCHLKLAHHNSNTIIIFDQPRIDVRFGDIFFFFLSKRSRLTIDFGNFHSRQIVDPWTALVEDFCDKTQQLTIFRDHVK